jgi:D-alanyl-D-alanine carboxypeptidase/D-alanyl-D-alanine-endopeptidase (penicillin-binding protein 4)
MIADVSFFDPILIPDGWLWMDIGNYYGVGPNSLCVHDNLYYLYFKPGKKVGSPAAVLNVNPEIPGLKFNNYMKTGPVGSGDHGYIYGGTGGFTRILRGTIPAGVNRFAIKGSIPDPALFFIQTLKKQLEKNDIKISKSVVVSNNQAAVDNIILEHDSPPLREIVYWINKKSINLYTEVLLKHLGKSNFGIGNFENGIKALKNFLREQGVPLEGLHLYDGSGLSPLNAITTKQMTLLLKNMTSRSMFHDFFNSLPIAGSDSDDGQLGHLCRGTAAANNLRAKTGLIARVRAHSGYVKTRSGRLLCFSMVANDHTGRARIIDRLHEKLMIQMAEMD